MTADSLTISQRIKERLPDKREMDKRELRFLEDKLKGFPGFVIGNGWSRTYYDIKVLRDWGATAVCNKLGFQYPGATVHYWGDGAFNKDVAANHQTLSSFLSITDRGNRSAYKD
jgi:hypothetical protein